jgi:hypothetical protein
MHAAAAQRPHRIDRAAVLDQERAGLAQMSALDRRLAARKCIEGTEAGDERRILLVGEVAGHVLRDRRGLDRRDGDLLAAAGATARGAGDLRPLAGCFHIAAHIRPHLVGEFVHGCGNAREALAGFGATRRIEGAIICRGLEMAVARLVGLGIRVLGRLRDVARRCRRHRRRGYWLGCDEGEGVGSRERDVGFAVLHERGCR